MNDDTKKRDPNRTELIRSNRDSGEAERPRIGSVTVIRGRGDDLGRCRIVPKGGSRHVLEDLGSTNGTLVDGTRVNQAWNLEDGQKILIGETVLRFELHDEIDLKFSAEVAHLLRTDPLTGLQSKRSFDHALAFAVTEAVRAGTPLSVLMMDLDGIKQINDTHGHLFGAYSIQQAGQIIQCELGQGDRACRFGGDEFTAYLPGQDRSAATAFAERIRSKLDTAGLEKDGVPLHPTVSIGVSTLPDDGEDQQELVTAADKALYRAKAAGKNRVCDRAKD